MEVLSSFKFRLSVYKCSRFATTIPDSKACLNSDWNDIRKPEMAIRAPRLSYITTDNILLSPKGSYRPTWWWTTAVKVKKKKNRASPSQLNDRTTNPEILLIAQCNCELPQRDPAENKLRGGKRRPLSQTYTAITVILQTKRLISSRCISLGNRNSE